VSDPVVEALHRHEPEAVVIGASAGAVDALNALLPGLPARIPATLLVVVHVPPDRRSALPELFASSCALRVAEAEDKIVAAAGTIYFAPAAYHLLVERGGQIALSMDDRVHMSRPSIDVLFESAAYAYGRRVLGIVLSGANADGAAGLGLIVKHGGLGWVQSPASATVPTMPVAALEANPHAVLAPSEMACALRAWGDSR
jgi:two-component system chemotaxis response regulator CheB